MDYDYWTSPATKAWLVPLCNAVILGVAGYISAKWNRPPDENGRTFPEALGHRLGRLWAACNRTYERTLQRWRVSH